jgi:DNA polymerase III subunit epsilon
MSVLKSIKKIAFKLLNINDSSTDGELIGDLDTSRFVVLDTETTGFDYENDRILCIGALALQNYSIRVDQSFEIYMQQDHYNKATAQIHGILKATVVNQPTELEALKEFLEFLGDAIIVAHHAIFDISMINKALERNNLPKLANKTLDTGILYKKTLLNSPLLVKKERYSLDDLAEKFDISKKDRHTALGDAFITAIAFLKIVSKLKEKKGFSLQQYFKN